MLVLFDIDQTLLSTHAAGMRALVAAGSELFGDGFTSEGVAYSGRLDPLIIADLLSLNQIEPSEANAVSLRDAYFESLSHALDQSEPAALKGAIDLVNMLEIMSEPTVGVLTGNFATSGRLKLSACGFDPSRFDIQVWGDESPHDPPHRDHLPPIGLTRYTELTGVELEPARAVIVGDTIYDVTCAKASGLRALGVATGKFSVEELTEAGADLVVEDLTDTEPLCDWIVAEP